MYVVSVHGGAESVYGVLCVCVVLCVSGGAGSLKFVVLARLVSPPTVLSSMGLCSVVCLSVLVLNWTGTY